MGDALHYESWKSDMAKWKADRAERDTAVARADEFVEVDYWCHFDDKGRAVRVHDTSTVHMDGCVHMYVRGADR
jgi:hypothetical protein